MFDPATADTGASAVAAGMLAPVFETALDPEMADHLDLLLAARDLWPASAARTGVLLDRTGTLAVGSESWLGGVALRLGALGMGGGHIPRSTAETLAPGLHPDVESALLSREDWRIDPLGALAALRAAAQALGVSFVRSEAPGSGLTLLATGAAPSPAPLSPIKGHILRLAAPGLTHVTLRGEGGYITPTRGGLAAGATMEAGVADPTADPAQAAPLREAAAQLLPALRDAVGTLHAGVRAASPAGLPLVGWSAEPGRLWAVGARRNGWLLAPLAAKIITACVMGDDPGPWAARLDPRRFEGKTSP